MISGIDKSDSRNFTLITVATFFFFCNFSSFFLLPLFIKNIRGDEADIGFIMGSFGITSLGSIPLVAFLIDKYGRRSFMMLGATLMFLASISYLLISELSPFIYVLRLLQGMAFAFFFTSAGTAAADFVPQIKRGRGLGIFGAFTIASYALGPTFGEKVMEHFGFNAFFIYASLFSLIALILVSLTKDANFERSKDRFGLGFFRFIFSRKMSVTLISNLIVAAGFGSILQFISAFLKPKGLDVFYFFLTYTIAVAAMRLFGGGISDTIGRKKIASPSLLLFSFSIAAMIFIDSMYKTILMALLFSVSYGMLYPTLSALAIDKARSDERGKAMGAFNASFSFGTNILAFAFGVIAKNFGYEGMYITSAVLVFIGFLLFTFFESNEKS